MAVHVADIFRCNACKGTYQDTQHDGTVYHHACPPLPPDEHGIEAERPNRRDETIVGGIEIETSKDGVRLVYSGEAAEAARKGKFTGIRSEGAGVTCLSDSNVVEPAWITVLKKRIAKQEED